MYPFKEKTIYIIIFSCIVSGYFKAADIKELEKKEIELMSQKQELEKTLVPYEQWTQKQRKMDRALKNTPTQVILYQELPAVRGLYESERDLMRDECSRWWPYNRCDEYAKRVERAKQHLQKLQQYKSTYDEITLIDGQLAQIRYDKDQINNKKRTDSDKHQSNVAIEDKLAQPLQEPKQPYFKRFWNWKANGWFAQMRQNRIQQGNRLKMSEYRYIPSFSSNNVEPW